MKIGVIADTHDRLPTARRAVAMFKRMNVGAILHAGDYVAPFAAKLFAPPELPERIPLYCVYGNNDGERAGLKGMLPQLEDGPMRIELGGRVIVMHHFVDWLDAGALRGAEVVVTGHTHEVVNETRDGVLYLNPGECCGWVNDRCTVAVLDTDGPTAEIIQVSD